jgi:hypothetical protein
MIKINHINIGFARVGKIIEMLDLSYFRTQAILVYINMGELLLTQKGLEYLMNWKILPGICLLK